MAAMITIFYEGDPLIMGYFDNLNNESLNEYKKNLKNKKKFINVFFLLLD
jgi:predicted adenine nucleotide alpha hydrolase (AANH) superfamily ATPase